MPSNRLLVIIPAYNEEETIVSVIRQTKKQMPSVRILVVNDGSKDNTLKEVNKTKVGLINLPFNLGIGGAVQTGLKYARENGFDKAVQLDADGQHDPQEIPRLLEKLKDADMVIGSRFLSKTNYPSSLLRKIGNKIFSLLIKLTCNRTITDSTSGFRAFGERAIDFFSDYYPADFPEPRSIVTFLKNGYRIKEVSSKMRKRQGGKSSVTPLKAIYLMISISIAILFESAKAKDVVYE